MRPTVATGPSHAQRTVTLSAHSRSLIEQVRANEAGRILSAEESLGIIGVDEETAVDLMTENQMLQYALYIASDLARRFEGRCRELQADLEIQRVSLTGNRQERRRKL